MQRFPELGPLETRSIVIPEGQSLPAGPWGFFELYCDEPGCDCRRVIIQVLRPETGWGKIWATIGFGWESADFYRKWSKFGSDPVEMQGPFLDPINSQSKYSPILLELFQQTVQAPEYVARLKRHYRMFRDSVEREHGRKAQIESNRVENRRKRLRDPNRRGRR